MLQEAIDIINEKILKLSREFEKGLIPKDEKEYWRGYKTGMEFALYGKV